MQLDDRQQQIVDYIVRAPAGEVIVIDGGAGTGKSVINNELRKRIPNMAIAAPSGSASVLVGGTTVHKLFGMTGRIYEGLPRLQVQRSLFAIHDRKTAMVELSKTYPKKAMEFLGSVGLIVIDEYAMVCCDTWDEMDMRLRYARKNPHEAFGGCKMVLSGDLGQLPPVVDDKDKKRLTELGYSSPWDFSVSRVFRES